MWSGKRMCRRGEGARWNAAGVVRLIKVKSAEFMSGSARMTGESFTIARPLLEKIGEEA